MQNSNPEPMPCTAEQGIMWRKPMSKQHAPVRVGAQHGSCPAESELTTLSYDCLLRTCHKYAHFNKNNLENGSYRNRENLLHVYKKIADWGLLSLFMRTNGKCNSSHAPSTGLSSILLSVSTKYSRRTGI